MLFILWRSGVHAAGQNPCGAAKAIKQPQQMLFGAAADRNGFCLIFYNPYILFVFSRKEFF